MDPPAWSACPDSRSSSKGGRITRIANRWSCLNCTNAPWLGRDHCTESLTSCLEGQDGLGVQKDCVMEGLVGGGIAALIEAA